MNTEQTYHTTAVVQQYREEAAAMNPALTGKLSDEELGDIAKKAVKDDQARARAAQRPNQQGYRTTERTAQAMNSPQSPFAAIQAIQEEQREGCIPTPTTDFWKHSETIGKKIDGTPMEVEKVAAWVSEGLEKQLAEKDAKIAEQAAQIVALREALIGCSKRLQVNIANFLGKPIPATCQDAPSALDNIKAVAAALSTPAPPVVPLEDAKALADALESLRYEQNGPPLERHKEHWQAAYDTASKVLAEFQSKHPQP